MPNDPNLLTEEQYNELLRDGGIQEAEAVTSPHAAGRTAPSLPPPLQITPPFFSGSLPPQFQLDSNFARARVVSTRVPHNDLMPLGPQANPSTNAAANSTSRVLAGTRGFTSQDLITDGQTKVALAKASSTPGSSGGFVAFNFRGVWISTVPYFKGDEVVYQTSYWQAQAASTNSAPATGNANWQVVGSYKAFRGPWSSSTAYVAGDEVTYLGNYWVATTASTNSAPSTSNSNWQIAGPVTLDAVNDGTDFGRPPISVYGPSSPIGKLTGFYLVSNPDFEIGMNNYVTYDNNGSGSITRSLIPISSAPSGIAPNGTNQVMKIVELKVGVGPTPGLGGFSYGPSGALSADTASALAADSFHPGDTLVIDLLAWIPTGYNLNWAANSLGTGGFFRWLNGSLANTYVSSLPGASAWRHYIGVVFTGPSPSANAFPYFYLTGVDGVTWYVGSLHIVDINQSHRHGGRHSIIGSGAHFHGLSADDFGNGYLTHVHFGNHRAFIDNNPGWAMYGTSGGDAGFGTFQGGTRNLFKTSASGAGPWHIMQEDTAVSGKTLASVHQSPGHHRWRERGGAASIYETDLVSGLHGFQGTPGVTTETFGTYSRVNSSQPGLRLLDTQASGREYVHFSGGAGAGAGVHSIYDATGGALRTQLNSTPRWGFFGSPIDDTDVFGTTFQVNHVGNPQLIAQDNSVSGVDWRLTSGNSAIGTGNLMRAGTNVSSSISGTQWGFFGTPADNLEIFAAHVRSTNSGGANAYRSNDTQASGREYYFGSGISSAGIGNIYDNTAGVTRTYVNNTPQWGFYGSPNQAVDVFGNGFVRTNLAGPNGFDASDSSVGGIAYKAFSGLSAAGFYNINDANAGATRTFLVSGTTPGLGILGSPSSSATDLDILGGTAENAALRVQVGSGAPWSTLRVNTATGGKTEGEFWGAATQLNTQERASGATAVVKDYANSRWGFNRNPNFDFEIQATATNGLQVTASGATNIRVNNTATGGRDFGYDVGNSAAGEQNIFDITGGATRTTLNSNPSWGFFGSPVYAVDNFNQYYRNSAAVPGMRLNDTSVSGREFIDLSGNSAAGVWTLDNNSSGGNQMFLNTSNQFGFFGSPANPIDIFAGGDGSPTRMRGSKPSFRVSNSDASGRDYEFNAGNNTAGFMEIIDRSANVMRLNMDGSGNYDFAAGTPVTGIGAAAVAFADLSANLKLKNIAEAVGSTSAPSTNSTTYAVIAEMTLTKTFKGNSIILTFVMSGIALNAGAEAFLAVFKDGSQLSGDYYTFYGNTISWNVPLAITLLDTPSAASHTYDIRWKVGAGTEQIACRTTVRRLQIVELG